MTSGPFGSVQYQMVGCGAEVKGSSCSLVVFVTSGQLLQLETENCFVTIISMHLCWPEPFKLTWVFWIQTVAIPDFQFPVKFVPVS